jgi:CBS domain-containing protein
MLARQKEGNPVHCWSIVEQVEATEWHDGYRTIGQFMSTDLFTLKPDDLIDLAASVMDWRHIRHVPVEDEEGHLVGLVTHRALLRSLNISNRTNDDDRPTTVREVMIENPVTVSPSTPSVEAIEIMRGNRVGCLPVVEDNQLVGIVTSYDFLEASARLFQQLFAAPVDKLASRARARGV